MRITPIGLILIAVVVTSSAQTVFIPGGLGGIGSSTGSNIGIGTSNPVSVLTIHGSGNTRPNVTTSNASGSAQWTFDNSSDGGNAWAVGRDQSGAFWIEQSTGATFGTGTTYQRFVIDTYGNVGIGTTAPASLLQIAGPITAGLSSGSTLGIDYLYGNYTYGKIFVIGSLYSTGGSFLGFGVKAKHGAVGYLSSTDWPLGRSSIEANSGYVSFLTGPSQASTDGGTVSISERMRIDPSGNVGIGTTNPSHKLTVNGTIKAKEVIVETTGWSDYVFADDYRLAPLSEVEAQIKAAKHLPGIPSAAEVAERGVSMGEMQKLLLQKIEELTLHQIAQEKRLNAQAERIGQLERENEKLRRR